MTRAERRSLVPQFEERTGQGRKETDPYSKLFEERIVFLGAPVDDISAGDVTAQMLALEGMDADRPIALYINSPGGSITAMLAICDTMRYVRPEIETTCVGQAGSAAAVLLAAGSPGRRQALPGARILLHEPEIETASGPATDLAIQAQEVLRLRGQTEAILAEATGRDPADIRRDLDRDRYFTAAEAKEYGLIDAVLTSRD
ncbi:ATP-dependent Clp protease proteolytic subunit [Actinomadura luteofluorescens]|uniref:ATP-dependent Clp protease proteolytic subunit n=1 Tax=Actinomadura luteofluorescens TaxID=46163 RepID=A0A7Y9EA63_9ACTN|nr:MULTISPECIES: ATP-dependent Clp protease proteolytic subunit [Actinomadura]MCR3739131.1 ATP-dependent Clp protease, protease subunit [Actinomadura glauciflava]NYD44023.1 ATP-dependent Clp protease protease subunit [Actinomadura luteofluorescens]